MNRKDLFACPFYFDRIEFDTKQVNNTLNKTEFLGNMSLDEIVLDNDFKFLFDPIDEIASKVMSELGFTKHIIFSSWISKTVIGVRHGLDHQHNNSFYSGILYLTDRASPIMFRHPLPWRWTSGLDDTNDGMIKSNQFFLSPKKGDIVLFPSFVSHLIMPHKDPIDRCSLAFNIVPCGRYGARDSTLNVSILK